ncbi:MAG: hypothetical protein AAGB31_15185, partial [Bdellovibrio sp.]
MISKKLFINLVAILVSLSSLSVQAADNQGGTGLLSFLIPAGTQDGTNMCVANDGDLISSNIRHGLRIFGVR